MPDNLKDQLKRDEGFASLPYRDTLGFLTIGYGRCLDRVPLSEPEADYLLQQDIARTVAAVAANVKGLDHLDPVRLAVLHNMAFNLGISGLMHFRKVIQAVRASDWATAAAEMLDSRWADQVGERARRLAEQMLTGEWR